MDVILLTTIVLPLMAALAVLVAPSGRLARGIALAAIWGVMILTGVLGAGFVRDGAGIQFVWSLPWLPDFGIALSFGLDGVSLIAFLLTSLVALAGMLVCRDGAGRDREFYALYLALVGGALGAFASTSLFFFYFFAEFEVLCSYLLIAGWSREKPEVASKAALQMTLFVAAGAILTLLGFMVLYAYSGTFDLATMRDLLAAGPLSLRTQQTVFVLLLGGFGVLLSMWPLHAWAPPAYTAAPTPVSMLSAGVLKQLGAYGLLRFALPLLPAAAQWAMPALAVLAIVNILYGALIALRQTDWKMLVGYFAISHAGYVLLGVAAMNRLGLSGVVVMMYAGALSVALLFLAAGTVEEQAGTREITRFSGLARRAPFIGVCTVMAALAAAGLPGFAGFVSEVMVMAGAWQAGTGLARGAVAVGAWGLVLSAVYLLGAVRKGVFGPPAVDILKVMDARSFRQRLPFLILLIALLVVGVWPRLLTDPLRKSACLEGRAPASALSRVTGGDSGVAGVPPATMTRVMTGER